MTVLDTRQWVSICAISDLIPGRGVAALVTDWHGADEQVAIFLLGADEAGDPIVRAVGNIDPFGRAAVISRGLLGDRDGTPTVASPLLKQVFSLDDGVCLDDSSVALPVYPTRVADGVVQVARRMGDT